MSGFIMEANCVYMSIEPEELTREKEKNTLHMNNTKITPELICDFYELQNHLQSTSTRKHLYTYQEDIQSIANIKIQNIKKLQKRILIKHAVIGYCSKLSANIQLSHITPK
jgi:hypothetical protein